MNEEAKKEEELPLSIRLHNAGKVVIERIDKRTKKINGFGNKERRNAYLMYLTMIEVQKDAIALCEYIDFLKQDNRFLRQQLERITNNSAWLESGVIPTMDTEAKKDENESEEKKEGKTIELSTAPAQKKSQAQATEKLSVNVAGAKVETATRAPVVEKRDVETGE